MEVLFPCCGSGAREVAAQSYDPQRQGRAGRAKPSQRASIASCTGSRLYQNRAVSWFASRGGKRMLSVGDGIRFGIGFVLASVVILFIVTAISVVFDVGFQVTPRHPKLEPR